MDGQRLWPQGSLSGEESGEGHPRSHVWSGTGEGFLRWGKAGCFSVNSAADQISATIPSSSDSPEQFSVKGARS